MLGYDGRHTEKTSFSFALITACGFASAIGQIVILRELLVLFYGNELSTGLIFASWLLWTAMGSTLAGRYGTRLAQDIWVLPGVLALLALLLPASVLWIRAARIIWAIPRGEMVGPLSMLWISLAGTGLFCLTSGALFGLAWSRLASHSGNGSNQPLAIYLGEALGAAMGGLFFYFVLLPRVSILNATLLTSLITLSTAALIWWLESVTRTRVTGMRMVEEAKPRSGEGGGDRRGIEPPPSEKTLPLCLEAPPIGKGTISDPRRRLLPLACLALIGALVALFSAFPGNLDRLSRRWQWGPSLLAVRDTPFQNLALLDDAGQFSLFTNGLLFFAFPDPQTSEYAVHPAMLQHREPETVLLIGGGGGGLLSEVLKHPQVQRVDYVEPDPEVLELAEEFLPGSATAALLDRRVHLFHADAGTFIRTTDATFDVVLMHLGDPVNAETNRFYTVEFFARVARLMQRDGVLSFAISSSPDMVGPAEARLLQSVHVTLRSVFPEVLVIPGESARFLATLAPGNLTADPEAMIARITDRKLDLRYVREYYLFDYLNPMRLNYMRSILGHSESAPVNRDFEPTCYFNNLLVWTAQAHPLLGETFTAISRVGRPLFWTVLGIFIAGLLGFFRSSYSTTRQAVTVNVLVVGGILMVLELILLLGFQILEGFVYTQLALIIALFMAGMAVGTGCLTLLSPGIGNPIRRIIRVQCLLTLYIVGTLGLLLLLQHQLQTVPRKPLPIGAIFSMLALAGGALGGLHFSLCVRAISASPTPSATTGPKLYALDLVGATGAVLAVSLFIMPVYGLITTMSALVLLCTAGVLTLVGRQAG
jgi:spermidine synthase